MVDWKAEKSLWEVGSSASQNGICDLSDSRLTVSVCDTESDLTALIGNGEGDLASS